MVVTHLLFGYIEDFIWGRSWKTLCEVHVSVAFFVHSLCLCGQWISICPLWIFGESFSILYSHHSSSVTGGQDLRSLWQCGGSGQSYLCRKDGVTVMSGFVYGHLGWWKIRPSFFQSSIVSGDVVWVGLVDGVLHLCWSLWLILILLDWKCFYVMFQNIFRWEVPYICFINCIVQCYGPVTKLCLWFVFVSFGCRLLLVVGW